MSELAAIIRNSILPVPPALPLAAANLIDIAGGVPTRHAIDTLGRNRQEHTNWCWAAAAVAINEHYRTQNPATPSRRQCDVVNHQYPGNECCTNGGTDACSDQGYLDKALAFVGHLNPSEPDATPANIRREIVAGRPVGVRIRTSNGSLHFVVIRGYSKQRLLAWDPATGGDVDVHISEWPARIGIWLNTYFTQ